LPICDSAICDFPLETARDACRGPLFFRSQIANRKLQIHNAAMATEEELRKALKAFKKRMKLTQLDDDSKLGHSPLTGSKSKVISIQPPAGFGKEIWEELAEKGYLKRDGIGFYELVAGK
jgi:hypothetical protein